MSVNQKQGFRPKDNFKKSKFNKNKVKAFHVIMKSFRVYVSGFVEEGFPSHKRMKTSEVFSMRNPDHKKAVMNYLNEYSLTSDGAIRALQNSKSIEKFNGFKKKYFPKKVIYEKAIKETVRRIKSDYKLDINNMTKFLYNIGVNLVIRPNMNPNDSGLKFLEGFSAFVHGIPTIFICLHVNTEYNRRILATILYELSYLINPQASNKTANLFCHSFFLTDEMILGSRGVELKEQFIEEINEDPSSLYTVVKRMLKDCGLTAGAIIKTLKAMRYIDSHTTEDKYNTLINDIRKEVMIGEYKLEPINIENTISFIKKTMKPIKKVIVKKKVY